MKLISLFSRFFGLNFFNFLVHCGIVARCPYVYINFSPRSFIEIIKIPQFIFLDWEIVPTEIQEQHDVNFRYNISLRRKGTEGEKYVLYILFCAPEPEETKTTTGEKLNNSNNQTTTNSSCIGKLIDFTENSFPKECQINGMIIVSLFRFNEIPDRLIHALDRYLATKGSPEKAFEYIIGEQNGPKHWEPIGKKHALKEYDQFALNTSCFW